MTTTGILITPAPECPAIAAQTPPDRAQRGRANIEFDLLTGAPYAYDHTSLAHAVHEAMAEVSGKPAQDFETFHAKGQPCMRASPLAKRYGWAEHSDADGKLALVDPASAVFARLMTDPTLLRKPPMRSKRG
jgi:hypothetical protein